MKNRCQRSRAPMLRAAPVLALATLLSPPALAQDEGEGEEPVGPPIEVAPEEHDHANELVELFAEVERKLREIDVLLSDAGAGDIPLSVPEDSGLDDLLKLSQSRGKDVVEGIDKILEMAGGT